MRIVKVFVPLPGVTALSPLGTTVTKYQTAERTLAWLEETNGAKNVNYDACMKTNELKEYLTNVSMEDKMKENKVENGIDNVEVCDKKGANDTSDKKKTKDVAEMKGKHGELKSKEMEIKDDNESERAPSTSRSEVVKVPSSGDVNSRCTSSKSNKTVKSVRFSLPEDHIKNSRGNLHSRGSSICEPFFGIPNGIQESGIYPHRPGSGWSITSSLSDHNNSYGSFSSMRNRGSMTTVKQIPGRFFPMATSLDEKRRALQDTLKQSRQSRVKSAPVVPNHGNFPRKSQKKEYCNGKASFSNDTSGIATPRSSLLKRDTTNCVQNKQKNTFWDNYETKTDTFSITFRDTDTPTYDPVHLGKTDTYSASKLPNAVQYNNVGSVNSYRSYAPTVTVRQSSQEFLGCLEGTSKMLHVKKQ